MLDFTTVQEDETTMPAAQQVISEAVSPNNAMTKWRENVWEWNRKSNREKQKDLLEKKEKRDSDVSSEASFTSTSVSASIAPQNLI